MNDAEERGWRIHSAVAGWTSNVDSKANFALTIESGLIAGVLALTSDHRIFHDLSGLAAVAFWTGIGVLAVAVLLVAWTVRPRLRSKSLETEAVDNFLYFGHARFWAVDDLADGLRNADLVPMLAKQVREMSVIAWNKYKHVQRSITVAGIGLALEVLAGILA